MEAGCSLAQCRKFGVTNEDITYQSMFVGYVVGEFEFMEGDNFLHPLFPSCGTVGMNVHPLGHLRVSLASHDPSAEMY